MIELQDGVVRGARDPGPHSGRSHGDCLLHICLGEKFKFKHQCSSRMGPYAVPITLGFSHNLFGLEERALLIPSFISAKPS